MPIEANKTKCYTLWEALAIADPLRFLFECCISNSVFFCEQIVLNVLHNIPSEKLEKLKLLNEHWKNIVTAELRRRTNKSREVR